MMNLQTWLEISMFLASLKLTNTQVATPPLSIKAGLLIPSNTSFMMPFENTAGAFTVALDRIKQENLLPNGTNITLYWRYEECVESTSMGYSLELVHDIGVDVLFAPPCIDGGLISGHVGNYYNIPVMLWGMTFDSEFANPTIFPTVASVISNYKDMGNVICNLLQYYSWTSFALIYQADEDGSCFSFQEDIEEISQQRENCLISYQEPVDSWNPDDIKFTINQLKNNARIIVLCFDSNEQQRRFAIALAEAGMNTDEYVYIIPDADMKIAVGLEETPFWVDPADAAHDAVAKSIGLHSLVLANNFQVAADTGKDYQEQFASFSQQVMSKMAEWPFYCTTCNRGQTASAYASTLYDVTYLYGLILSQTIKTYGINTTVIRNGRLITKNSDIEFEGLTGTVKLGPDGVRDSTYAIFGYNDDGKRVQYLSFATADTGIEVTKLYTDAASTIWAHHGGKTPLSRPLCGYDGKSCATDFFKEYLGYFIAAIIIVIVIVCATIYGIFYFFNLRAKEIERQNQLWQISVQSLTLPSKSKAGSMFSLQSGPSTNSSKFTFESMKSNKYFLTYILHGERVMAIKHTISAKFDSAEMAELRAMRILDHGNVNKFIGVTVDSPELMSIWRYCSRGTIQDIITSSTFQLDGFFMYSLIRDLTEGLAFIHSSFLSHHGYLKSSNCMIDDRWQVKISDYGLKEFRAAEKREASEQLWTAPEILRNEGASVSKPGDVYSFAIICSEIINMKPPFEPGNHHDPEEIVYLVKKGGRMPTRPPLEPASNDISPALLHLIKDCWNENPSDRPRMETVKTLLKSMNTGKSANLMDHVLNILESYAGSLEEEVEERTKELVEEKKKSDVLLYRMLPKQVAEKLKLGQSVEPETFECVTIFFSDVVSFTTLASRSTPLQVVNLLNDLYTVLDGIIAEYDVYKVETIGDGYLCVSGLPHRNGNEHGRHIANMSLAMMKALERYTIPHLPGEKISLRIGIHTGGVVSGVVGLAMPRYCLFGDTVNTASRMESNGKPNRVHMSAEANQFLTKVIGGYVTQSRGEVIIKGKGVMETFWLVGLESDLEIQRQFYAQEGANLVKKEEAKAPIAKIDDDTSEIL